MAASAISTSENYTSIKSKNGLLEYPQQLRGRPIVPSHQMHPSTIAYVHEIATHHHHLDFSGEQYICSWICKMQ